MPNPPALTTAIALLLALLGGAAHAHTATVAVASNFAAAGEALARRFEAQSGHRLTLSFGATGKHYAQIVNGAPFDLFLAADVERPRRLEAEGHGVPGTRRSYAVGRLALWSPDPGRVDAQGRVLVEGRFRHLAMANPRLAPYGRAARQVLEAAGLWEALQGRLVRGENIGQAYQFVASGNADLGFVAYAQVLRPDGRVEGSVWLPPAQWYRPIEQQAILLRHGADNPAARDFLDYLLGPAGQALIQRYGYAVPH